MNSKLLAVLGLVVIAATIQTKAESFPIKYQPEMDSINIDEYIRDQKAMDRQVQCVLHDGPCDAVGRWVKPRVTSAFMGECLMCTPKQVENIKKIMENMQRTRPVEYRMAIVQFLLKAGVTSKAVP